MEDSNIWRPAKAKGRSADQELFVESPDKPDIASVMNKHRTRIYLNQLTASKHQLTISSDILIIRLSDNQKGERRCH